MTTTEIIQFGIQNNIKNGKELDILIKTIGFSLLENTYPFVNVELSNFEELLIMLNGTLKYGYYLYKETKEFYFTAIYNDIDKFPIARCYFLRIHLNNGPKTLISLNNHNYKFFPLSDNLLSQYINEDNYLERINNFKNNIENNLYVKSFSELFEGRKSNTLTSSALLLKSEGCYNCGDSKITNFINSTISIENKGMVIGAFTCELCYKKALDSKSILDFIFNRFGILSPFGFESITEKELLDMTILFIENELKCKNIEVISKKRKDREGVLKNEYNIKCIRKSQFIIRFRLFNLFDYGYMIFTPKDEQVFRIDSADHHNSKLQFAPDHYHYDLQNDNNKVKSSFTFGTILLDYKLILNLIEKAERNYDNY
ncbi:DUF6516 family protein [Aliarcobacter butzleri]|uniref:DUF6516 family protein n=1 Tax=Aliarcobacter butzleri TaxID=28197 RepID=UPI0021B3CCC7|nr:DUF6516 family protein [Aliarcobacter butzleri]MCT7611469.1 DUF6516 family protein [Aliarcobacter butzleri]